MMFKRIAMLALIVLTLLAADAAVVTKRVLIDYPLDEFKENGTNPFQWFAYNPADADSIYRFTAAPFHGRVMAHPAIVTGMWRFYRGNAYKVDAAPTFSTNSVRDIVKVEMQFSASDYNNASQVTARCGEITFNGDASAPIVTWTGNVKSLQLFFEKSCCIERVWVTIQYRDGADAVGHPIFSPVDQADFRSASKSVTISSPTPGAEIYYCLNDRSPSATFTKYTGPLTISNTTYIRAYCKKGDLIGGEDTCRIVKNNSNMVVKDKAFYQSKTYTWVDVKGVRGTPGATITSDMTEEATTTEQIKALLRAVYTDPTIPGQIYQNIGEGTSYNRYTTYPRDLEHGFVTPGQQTMIDAANGWNIPPLPSDPVEGYTPLIVKVRDDYVGYNDFIAGNYRHGDIDSAHYKSATPRMDRLISESYESVQLLYNGFHTPVDESKGFPDEGYNPGALFSYTGQLNRYFIISKGGGLWNCNWPLCGLFEEMAADGGYLYKSHADMSGSNVSILGLISDNKTFPISHVCPGVTYVNHFVTIDENTNPKPVQLSNMLLFVPDYRMKYWEKSAQRATPWPVDSIFSWPTQHSRDIGGRGGFQMYHGRHLPTMAVYNVNLNASASPTATAHVYRATPTWKSVIDDLTPATGIAQDYLLYTVSDDGNGNEILTPLNDGNVLNVNSFSHDVPQQATSYEITYLIKARMQGTDMDYVLSNKATVVIPGYEDTRLGLLNVSESHLCEHRLQEQKNVYCNYVRLNNDASHPIMAGQLANGVQLTLHRLDQDRQELGEVATVTVLSKETDAGTTTWGYNIVMNTTMQSDATAGRYHSGTGKFTAGSNGVVDFGDIYIADQFSASTAENTHPDRYYYQLKMVDALNNHIESHPVEVKVHKTTLGVNVALSQSDVDGDTGRGLQQERDITMTMGVGNESNLLTYDVLCDGSDVLARAQRTLDGKYWTMGMSAGGTLTHQTDNIDFVTGHQMMDLQINAHANAGQAHQFATVISAIGHDIDGSTVVNTYGAGRHTEEVPTVTVAVSNQQRSQPWAGPTRWLMSYSCDVTLSSTLPDGQSRYLYRLWRVNPDGTETLLNGLPENSGTGEGGASWTTSYGNLSSTEATITVHDIFNDLPLGTFQGSKFDVRYIARLYSRYGAAAGGSGAPRRAYTNSDFNFAHAAATASFDMGVVTGVGVVEMGRQPVSVTYHNALGVASSRPFSGVNIVVTRYSDGTAETTKVIR